MTEILHVFKFMWILQSLLLLLTNFALIPGTPLCRMIVKEYYDGNYAKCVFTLILKQLIPWVLMLIILTMNGVLIITNN